MNICFGATAINVRGLFIRSTYFASAPGSQTAIFGNLGGRSESVNVAIPIAAGNMIGVELYGPQTHFSQGGGQGGSSFSCQADSGPVYTYASFCVGHHVSAGATWIDTGSALSGGQIDGNFIGTGAALTASGTINTASKLTTSGAKMVCTGCSITSGGSGGAAGVWAFANNTTITLYGSTALYREALVGIHRCHRHQLSISGRRRQCVADYRNSVGARCWRKYPGHRGKLRNRDWHWRLHRIFYAGIKNSGQRHVHYRDNASFYLHQHHD